MVRILYIDCDSLRPDHLGCYGYERETSPTIDGLGSDGRRFTNYYVSDAPCLPSRTALLSGRHGIHTGAVDHAGVHAEPRPVGPDRQFDGSGPFRTLPSALRQLGLSTCLVSSFPNRHGASHAVDGFETWYDPSNDGLERADTVTTHVRRWLDEFVSEEKWFCHVTFWDPHIPYNSPETYGNPFASDPPPEWPPQALIDEHYASYGPHSAHDLLDFGENPTSPREPSEIADREDFNRYVDGYDVGIRYMDDHIAEVLDVLEDAGVFEETFVIVSADHGENLGELNVYGDHQTPDQHTCHVPLIVHGPGVARGVDSRFHSNVDLAPTLVELAGGSPAERWDGRSFARSITAGADVGREQVVFGHGAHTVGRGVRWGKWLLMRVYEPGVKDLDPVMLFQLDEDPHETTNLVERCPEIAADGIRRLDGWVTDRLMDAALGRRGGNPRIPEGVTDPLWSVIREGGPFHTTRSLDVEAYCERLERTERGHHVESIRRRYGEDPLGNWE